VGRSEPGAFTRREADVMNVLWNLGSATAEQVRLALPDEPHDSTVRTMLRILVEKGFVKRFGGGPAYVYRPALPRANAQKKAVANLLERFFGGSAEELVLGLLRERRLTHKKLEQLQKQIEKPAKGDLE
jgi:predicted transcriptional regulator